MARVDVSPRSLVVRVVVSAAATIALLAVLAGSASAAPGKTCGQLVLDDWYDNYRVDSTIYDEPCYREAVTLLGIDIRDYGTAEDDILRALSYARRGKLDPGDGTGGPVAAAAVADPSSVPLPLIVVGAIALLLLAAGAAGYLKRRLSGGPPASA